MQNIEDVLNAISTPKKANTGTNKKRKWREIEQLKERHQLEKELRAFDDSLEHMLEEF